MARKPKYAAVTLSEQNGVRYLHFGTEWVQGAMRLRKPDWLELEYAQQMMVWMLWNDAPLHIAQLGLGAAALTKYCYRQFPEARVTAVELNPSVVTICRSMFRLPQDDERLQVLEMNALDFVQNMKNRKQMDVLQVDLYDATAQGPVLDTIEFYKACATSLGQRGIMTVNLFGNHPSYTKNIRAMEQAFDKVYCLPETNEGNIVAIAFKIEPEWHWDMLYARAENIKLNTKLPAISWVHGLKTWQAKCYGA